jgi:DNA-directed RNA polymerase specialized sigma24 family protein
MRTLPNNLFSSAYLNVVDEETSLVEAGIRKHESLLTKIISGFGFNKIESREILGEVCLEAKKKYVVYSGTLPFKVWLSKILIRKCIFKISSDFFSGVKNAQLHPQAFASYLTGKSIFGTSHEPTPISFWIVYVLHNYIGFTEKEIAEILNTNTLSVRERLNKALQFIAKT